MVINFSGNSTVIPLKNIERKETKNTCCPRESLLTFGTGKTDETQEPNEKLAIGKSLFQGFTRPIKQIAKAFIESPMSTAVIVLATAAAVRSIKLIGNTLPIAILGIGAIKIGGGTLGAYKNHRNHNDKAANASIRNIGEGAFDVVLTVNQASKAAGEISNNLKVLTAASPEVNNMQKLYAFIQQFQKPEGLAECPKTVSEVASRLGKDITEGLNIIRGLAPLPLDKIKLEQIKKLGEQLTPENKEKVLKLLEQLKGSTNSNKATEIATQIGAIFENEKISKVNPFIIKDMVDIVIKYPEALPVLKEAMKSGKTVDEVAEMIRSVTKTTKYDPPPPVTVAVSNEAVSNEILPSTEITEDEGNNQR